MALDRRELEMFLNQARIKLPGSSDAGIRAEFYDTLKEFFEDSNTWTEDITLDPVANTQDYTLVPVEDGQIIRLVGVWDAKFLPIPAFMQNFASIHLLHPPQPNQSAVPWMVRVVKNVTLPLTKDDLPVAPDWTLRVYSVTILDGLLGRMMSQMDKTFSDKERGVYHLRRFRTGIQIARTAQARQNTVGAQEWAYPRGWQNRTQRGGVSTAWPTRAF